MHITTQYLANEEKAIVAKSKVEALEAKASGLRNDLDVAMDALNASKEKTKILTEQLESEKLVVKQKDDLLANVGQQMKIAVAKAVTAFQTTEEYNTILFQWYFKGFELLRRYMIKHSSGVDLENWTSRPLIERWKRTRLPKYRLRRRRPLALNLLRLKGTMVMPLKLKALEVFFFFFFGCPSCFWGFSFEQSILYDMLFA